MRRPRNKTETDTPLFYEAMQSMNKDHPMTEAEMQQTINRMKAEGRLPNPEQWEQIKLRLEAELRKVARKPRR